MVLACLHKIHEGRFDDTEHYFMVSGHCYHPCDRDFGHIEKKAKVWKEHYITHIQSPRSTKPFKVFQMDRNMFLDWGILQTSISKRKPKETKLKEIQVFLYSSQCKHSYVIKTGYDDALALCTEVQLQKGKFR
jgi:hypothetical protein